MKSSVSPFYRILLFAFFLGGMSMFSSDGQLKAQNVISQDLFSLPTGTFVTAQVAKTRLETRINTLKSQLQGLTEGTPQYQSVWTQYIYYTTILESVNGGKPIPQSIVDGLTAVSTDVYGLTRTTLLQYRTEAINLLKA